MLVHTYRSYWACKFHFVFLSKECNKDITIKCYKTYVRPSVSVSMSMPQSSGHPTYNLTSTYVLEMVQRKAARFVFGNYSRYSSVSAMLNELDWRTLEKRGEFNFSDVTQNH